MNQWKNSTLLSEPANRSCPFFFTVIHFQQHLKKSRISEFVFLKIHLLKSEILGSINCTRRRKFSPKAVTPLYFPQKNYNPQKSQSFGSLTVFSFSAFSRKLVSKSEIFSSMEKKRVMQSSSALAYMPNFFQKHL